MLIRSIRNFGKTYEQNSIFVPDTEEIINSETDIDFLGDNCEVELLQDFPEEIFLKLSLNPVPINEITKLVRTEKSATLKVENIFDQKNFHSGSPLKNHFCKDVIIKYEGSGCFSKDNQTKNFYGKHFENYELDFSDEIYRMSFHTCGNIILKEESDNHKIKLQNGEIVNLVFYPCGGFFSYGCHTKQIEPCVFRGEIYQNSLKVKAYTFSYLKSEGYDPSKDSEKYKKVESLVSDHDSLYEKIQNGEIKINLINKKSKEKCIFKSEAVSHVQNTNLITIKFTKEEEK